MITRTEQDTRYGNVAMWTDVLGVCVYVGWGGWGGVGWGLQLQISLADDGPLLKTTNTPSCLQFFGIQ